MFIFSIFKDIGQTHFASKEENEEDLKDKINWTKLWVELQKCQVPWKVKNFSKKFGLALFFFVLSFYDLLSDTFVAK